MAPLAKINGFNSTHAVLFYCLSGTAGVKERGRSVTGNDVKQRKERIMDKEALKALGLMDEQVAKIHEDYGKNYVTKAQFNERAGELKHEKEEREKTAKALDDLKKQHESDADFQKQIAELQKAAKDREAEYAKQVEQMKLDSAIDKALTGAKVRNTKAARALLDMADAKLNDKGEVEGLSAKIEALKKSDGWERFFRASLE